MQVCWAVAEKMIIKLNRNTSVNDFIAVEVMGLRQINLVNLREFIRFTLSVQFCPYKVFNSHTFDLTSLYPKIKKSTIICAEKCSLIFWQYEFQLL
jgi:hypothetical protein